MGDTDKPFSWMVNFIGVEGFRENIRIEDTDTKSLVERRASVLKVLSDFGCVPDMRKLFEDNGTKAGKLAQSEPKTGDAATSGQPSSKLARFAKAPAAEAKPAQSTEEALAQLKESGFLSSDQADETAEKLGVAAPAKAAVVDTTAKPSKLAGFKPKPTPAPAPAPKQEGPASEPNVSPKLARFVRPEQKKD